MYSGLASVYCNRFLVFFRCSGGRRFSEGTSADREIQRTLMEVSDSLSSRNSIFITVFQIVKPSAGNFFEDFEVKLILLFGKDLYSKLTSVAPNDI